MIAGPFQGVFRRGTRPPGPLMCNVNHKTLNTECNECTSILRILGVADDECGGQDIGEHSKLPHRGLEARVHRQNARTRPCGNLIAKWGHGKRISPVQGGPVPTLLPYPKVLWHPALESLPSLSFPSSDTPSQ